MPALKFNLFRLCLSAGILAAGLGIAAGPAQEPEPGEDVFAAPPSEAENKGVNLGPNVNSEYSDFGPVISADGNFLYFTSDRPGGLAGQDFWVSERVNGVWQPAKNLGPPVNTPGDEGPDVFSIAEDALYFTACNRSDGLGGCDLYITRKTKEGWTTPVNLGKPINTASNEVNASIDATGAILVFASDRPGGLGNYDLWISRRAKNPIGVVPLLPEHFRWGTPENPGPAINTPGWEGVGFILPDGKTLYFSSTGRGGLGKADIFKSIFDGNNWSEPENLGEIINTPRDDIYFSLPGSGELAYFSSDMRGGRGREDIYSISLPFLIPRRHVHVVRGFVRDGKSGGAVAAQITFLDPKTRQDFAYTESDPETGAYQIIVCKSEAELVVKAKRYQTFSEPMALAGQANMLILKDVELVPLSK
jgi:hypothetical protein